MTTTRKNPRYCDLPVGSIAPGDWSHPYRCSGNVDAMHPVPQQGPFPVRVGDMDCFAETMAVREEEA